MKKVEKTLERFLFGDPARGERLKEPSSFPIAELDFEQYNRWAAEFKVGSLYSKPFDRPMYEWNSNNFVCTTF